MSTATIKWIIIGATVITAIFALAPGLFAEEHVFFRRIAVFGLCVFIGALYLEYLRRSRT